MILRNLAKECDRWGVSNRARAAIANAALIDAGVITPEDQTNVIDKNKLRRALQDYRKERQVEDTKILEEKQGQAYYIAGKKTMSPILSQRVGQARRLLWQCWPSSACTSWMAAGRLWGVIAPQLTLASTLEHLLPLKI